VLNDDVGDDSHFTFMHNAQVASLRQELAQQPVTTAVLSLSVFTKPTYMYSSHTNVINPKFIYNNSTLAFNPNSRPVHVRDVYDPITPRGNYSTNRGMYRKKPRSIEDLADRK
jgi:hypothetical protein